MPLILSTTIRAAIECNAEYENASDISGMLLIAEFHKDTLHSITKVILKMYNLLLKQLQFV